MCRKLSICPELGRRRRAGVNPPSRLRPAGVLSPDFRRPFNGGVKDPALARRRFRPVSRCFEFSKIQKEVSGKDAKVATREKVGQLPRGREVVHDLIWSLLSIYQML